VNSPTPFVFEAGGEAKRHAPATARNRDVITAALSGILPVTGHVLEIASGTGEHIVHFAQVFPALSWQPSDPDPIAMASIEAWRADASADNVKPPVQLDAAGQWPVVDANAIICINMAHISPWAATLGLLRNAGLTLASGEPLYLYGPFWQRNVPPSDGNIAFDAALKQQDAAWGLRYVEDVADEATRAGLRLDAIIPMPANNLSVIFRRS
jgi:hypothetical protein